jgi:hypothetical protein
MLSSSFRCDQICKYKIYDFGHTLLCCLSRTWMFNSEAAAKHELFSTNPPLSTFATIVPRLFVEKHLTDRPFVDKHLIMGSQGQSRVDQNVIRRNVFRPKDAWQLQCPARFQVSVIEGKQNLSFRQSYKTFSLRLSWNKLECLYPEFFNASSAA